MFWGCFAASGTGCVAPRNREITKVFWSGVFHPVSRSCVSVKGHGSSSRKMTEKTHQKAPRNGLNENAGLFQSDQH